MKTKLFFCVAVCATLSIFSQNAKMKPSGMENQKKLIKMEANENQVSIINTVEKTKVNTVSSAPAQHSTSKTSAVNSWTNVTTSPSPFGSLISFCKPLSYNDELNAVCFIHRRPTNYVTSPPTVGPSNHVNALISADWGNNWDSTLVYDNNTNWARYPGGGIYNPPGNSLLTAAYALVAGPTTPAAGAWNGNYYASKSLATYNNAGSTVPNAQQWMDIQNPNPNVGRHDFAAYGYNSTDDGKVRVLAGIMDDGTGADTAVMMITGTFNSGVFAYTGTRFNPPSTVDGIGDDNWLSRPAMAWNEVGTIGYLGVMGQRIGSTGRNAGMQPMVWKTTNSGASWAPIAGIDFNAPAFAPVVYKLTSQGSSTLEVPNFLWLEGWDMSVDANNKLHLFSSLVGHYSADPDSLNYTSGFGTDSYRYPHTPGLRPYLYDFMTDGSSAWTYNTVDSMSSEGVSGDPAGAGYSENPWSVNAGTKQRLDARIQMSRTPNGKYIFYSWTESDTNFTNNAKKFNVKPDIKVRAYGVDENLVSTNEVNITGGSGSNANVDSKAFWHFMSTKTNSATVAVISPTLTTMSAKLPFTTSNNPGLISAGFSTSHWYNTTQNTFSFTPKGVSIAENSMNSATGSFMYPNPTSDNTSLAIELKDNDKVEVVVFNLMGQSIMSTTFDGRTGENIINIDISGLKAGVFLVKVNVANASSTKKLVIQ